MSLLIIPLALAIVAIILIIIGSIQLFSGAAEKKTIGKINLLIGLVLITLLISVLVFIGTSFSRA